MTVNISSLHPEGGTVRIDGSAANISSGFTGTYFAEHDITLTAEAKDGYTFAGWSGTITSSDAEITVSPAEAGSVRALFLRSGEKLCKVTFTDGEKSIDTYVIPGESAAFPADVFTKKGYTASASGLDRITADKTIKVVYTGNNYKIRLLPAGGKGSVITVNAVYGKELTLPKNTFTRTGYTFKGWSDITTGSAKYADGGKVKDLTSVKDGAVSLYAVWEKNVIVLTKDISKCTVNMAEDRFIYTGGEIRPSISVSDGGKSLTEGRDYTVSYVNNTDCGTAEAVITGLKLYNGSVAKSFTIAPTAPKLTSFVRTKTAIRLKWSAVPGADSYSVYRQVGTEYRLAGTVSSPAFTDTKLETGAVYRYKVYASGGGISSESADCALCTKSTVPTLKGSSPSKSKLKLSWSKSATGTGYQIVYSTKKTGGYKLMKYLDLTRSSFATSKSSISGKTLYIKMRVYQKVDGKKFYSGFSNIIKVKVK